MVEYVVRHAETGRITTYPDAEGYESAWDWFESIGEEQAVAWYTSWDRAANVPVKDEIWADPECTTLTPDWADIVTAAYAWSFFKA